MLSSTASQMEHRKENIIETKKKTINKTIEFVFTTFYGTKI
jgi:hypothetical protein